MRPLLLFALLILPAAAQFKAEDKDGRIEIRDGDKLVFGYQHKPLKNPKGGEIFAASAFIHPLATPSGFVLTDIQPDDHLHHLGVWWPWKMVQVDGKKYITWEMQKKEGRHDAVEAEFHPNVDTNVEITGFNQVKIHPEGGELRPVIEEDVAIRFGRFGKEGYQIDMQIKQREPSEEVVIPKYRYSGFCWRGTPEWTSENSSLLSSGGHHRDNANHQPAKWCLVSGDTPTGKATMLIMSAAAKDAGQPELLRVWGSKMHHGNPFVNFNPVAKKDVVLKSKNKAVSLRCYRLIMVDRELKAEEADKLWENWGGGMN